MQKSQNILKLPENYIDINYELYVKETENYDVKK